MQYIGTSTMDRNTENWIAIERHALTPGGRIAWLQGWIAGLEFRIAELQGRGSRKIIEREEHSLRAYREMLEEAEKT